MDVKPETSAKSTLTCLRSPESAARSFRIRAARCAGVYARGDSNRGDATAGAGGTAAASGAPHAPQNFFPVGTPAPHAGHSTSSVAPHSSQNLTPGRFSVRHAGHRIPDILRERTA